MWVIKMDKNQFDEFLHRSEEEKQQKYRQIGQQYHNTYPLKDVSTDNIPIKMGLPLPEEVYKIRTLHDRPPENPRIEFEGK